MRRLPKTIETLMRLSVFNPFALSSSKKLKDRAALLFNESVLRVKPDTNNTLKLLIPTSILLKVMQNGAAVPVDGVLVSTKPGAA